MLFVSPRASMHFMCISYHYQESIVFIADDWYRFRINRKAEPRLTLVHIVYSTALPTNIIKVYSSWERSSLPRVVCPSRGTGNRLTLHVRWGMIFLLLTLKMTTAQVVETSVTTTNKLSKDYRPSPGLSRKTNIFFLVPIPL